MIGRSLGQTIEVLGQEWRFKGQAGGSSSAVQHQPVPSHKKGWGKAGWGSLRRQVQTWFGGPQFELTVWSHGSTRNHGPGSSHFTISDRSILLNFSRGSRGNFAQGTPTKHSVTHSLTHPPSHSLTHSITHSPTHPPPTHSLTHSPHYLPHTHTLTHSRTRARTHSLTHPPTHSLTHSASFAWQAWHNVHCQGVGCTPWRPLGLRLFCVAGVAQCACTPWRPLGVSASFAWQAWHNVHCQGVGCTPWRPLGLRLFCVAGVAQCALPRGRMYALASLGSPPLLRGRRGTMCTAKGSDVRPGVPVGLRLFCVAGVAQCALPRGRMYALASLGSPSLLCGRRGTMCTAKGSDAPWRPSGLRLFCMAGVAQCALPRGRMYALASLGSPPLLRGRRGTMCTAKGSDVRPGVPRVSASFAWQAWHNVHCQGVGCTPWRPLGLRLFCVAGVAQCALPRGRMYAPASLGSPPLLRGRRGTMCMCALASLGCLRLFRVAGVAQCALPRGRIYALASLGSPPLLRGRRGTMCTAKGSDVRPGVPRVSASFAWQAWHNVHCQGVGCTPWRPLGLRLFCVAGVAQCALPRGRMYAPASLGSPPLLRGRRGTMSTALGLPHSSTHSRTHARTLARSLTQTTLTSLTHTNLTSLTHTLTHSPVHAHTYTHTLPTITPPSPLITRPPSPLHHSYHSSSLLAFLCSV